MENNFRAHFGPPPIRTVGSSVRAVVWPRPSKPSGPLADLIPQGCGADVRLLAVLVAVGRDFCRRLRNRQLEDERDERDGQQSQLRKVRRL